MKFVAIIEYGDTEKVKQLHPVHREYLRRFLENEQLRAAGPFANDEGALWVLDAETAEAAEEIVKGDPMWRQEQLSVGRFAHSPIGLHSRLRAYPHLAAHLRLRH